LIEFDRKGTVSSNPMGIALKKSVGFGPLRRLKTLGHCWIAQDTANKQQNNSGHRYDLTWVFLIAMAVTLGTQGP